MFLFVFIYFLSLQLLLYFHLILRKNLFKFIGQISELNFNQLVFDFHAFQGENSKLLFQQSHNSIHM